VSKEVTSVRVFLRHLHAAKPRPICHSGGRKWWNRRGWSWSDFVRNGIDGQKLLDTGDAFAIRVVRAAEAEADSGR
jgi:hypothetical protein